MNGVLLDEQADIRGACWLITGIPRQGAPGAHLHETAYPRLKSQPSEKELQEVYTPTQDDLVLAGRVAREHTAKFGFLVLLKTFQRLGYFILLRDVPVAITDRVLRALGLLIVPGVTSRSVRPTTLRVKRCLKRGQPGGFRSGLKVPETGTSCVRQE